MVGVSDSFSCAAKMCAIKLQPCSLYISTGTYALLLDQLEKVCGFSNSDLFDSFVVEVFFLNSLQVQLIRSVPLLRWPLLLLCQELAILGYPFL